MSKALELADKLEKLTASGSWYDGKLAAAELRRLAAVEAAALAFVAGAQKEFAPKEFKALQDALGETK